MEAPMCLVCGGDLFFLGALGPMCHFRCRDCGMDHSRMEHDHEAEGWSHDRNDHNGRLVTHG